MKPDAVQHADYETEKIIAIWWILSKQYFFLAVIDNISVCDSSERSFDIFSNNTFSQVYWLM